MKPTNATELMVRSSTVSLLLVAIGCATATGQTVPVQPSAAVPKAGERLVSTASPTMLESFLKNQASELLARRRREVAATLTPEQIAQR
jgi:hypothetical protein